MKKVSIIILAGLMLIGCKNEEPTQPQPVVFDTPTWQVKTNKGYSTMTIIMAMPDSIQCDTADIIGVFTNDNSECLAVQKPTQVGDSLLGFLTVVAPDSMDDCYLRYFQSTTHYIHVTAPSAVRFDNDARIGSLTAPKQYNWNVIKQ